MRLMILSRGEIRKTTEVYGEGNRSKVVLRVIKGQGAERLYKRTIDRGGKWL